MATTASTPPSSDSSSGTAAHIAALARKHEALENRIQAMTNSPAGQVQNSDEVRRLKRKKLVLKDMISHLQQAESSDQTQH